MPFRVTFGAAFLGVLSFAVWFVWHDGLSSFADDSVSYLIQAQVFSPYSEASEAVRRTFSQETNYPPLFPLLLGLTGASHRFLYAHLVVAACFAAAWTAMYCYGSRRLASRSAALIASVLFATSPAAWWNLLGILSENLYLALTLAFFCLHDRQHSRPQSSPWLLVGLGLLLAAVVLTRVIGVALVAAYAVSTVLDRTPQNVPRLHRLAVLGVPVVALSAWVWLRSLEGIGLYGSLAAGLVQHLGHGGASVASFVDVVSPQWAAVFPAWLTSMIFYWTSPHAPGYLVAALGAVLAAAGTVGGAVRGKLDGWYILIYLAIAVVWPTSDQMVRFLYPVFPLLLLQAAWVAKVLGDRLCGVRVGRYAPHLLLLLLLSASAPSLAFVVHRAGQRVPRDYSRISEFYRVPDLPAARRKADLHLRLFDDMQRIRAATDPRSVVLWDTPDYLALLADRQGIPFPRATARRSMLTAIERGPARYVFLSKLNPRNTTQATAIVEGLNALAGVATPQWWRTAEDGSELAAVFLKFDERRLRQEISRLRNAEPETCTMP